MSGKTPPHRGNTRCAKNFDCKTRCSLHLAAQELHRAAPQPEVKVAMGDKKPAAKPAKGGKADSKKK
jgi:hypothetical protein